MTDSASKTWPSHDAEARFIDLVSAALNEGPQVVQLPSGDEVVVVSRAEFESVKLSPQEFYLKNRRDVPEPDPIDEAINQVRRSGLTMFGSHR